jgi:hypothetical protein
MAAGGAAAAAAISNAIIAAGGIARVVPDVFLSLLDRAENPLVVYTNCWVLFKVAGKHQYLTSYRGLTFVTRSTDELILPKGTEVIRARSMYLPV